MRKKKIRLVWERKYHFVILRIVWCLDFFQSSFLPGEGGRLFHSSNLGHLYLCNDTNIECETYNLDVLKTTLDYIKGEEIFMQ